MARVDRIAEPRRGRTDTFRSVASPRRALTFQFQLTNSGTILPTVLDRPRDPRRRLLEGVAARDRHPDLDPAPAGHLRPRRHAAEAERPAMHGGPDHGHVPYMTLSTPAAESMSSTETSRCARCRTSITLSWTHTLDQPVPRRARPRRPSSSMAKAVTAIVRAELPQRRVWGCPLSVRGLQAWPGRPASCRAALRSQPRSAEPHRR